MALRMAVRSDFWLFSFVISIDRSMPFSHAKTVARIEPWRGAKMTQISRTYGITASISGSKIGHSLTPTILLVARSEKPSKMPACVLTPVKTARRRLARP